MQRHSEGTTAVLPEAPSEKELDIADAREVKRYLDTLEDDVFSATRGQELKSLSVNGLHVLLVAAASGQSPGAGTLIQRIVQLWVSRLLAHREGLALQEAVKSGSTEALATLLNLGGASVLAAATTEERAISSGTDSTDSKQCRDSEGEDSGLPLSLLSLCIECGNSSMLGLLLEQLRSSRSGLGLDSVRQVLSRISKAGGRDNEGQELVVTLSSHLVVELSHLGNAQYRQGDLDGAISSYKEAIALCEQSGASAKPSNAEPTGNSVAQCGRSKNVPEAASRSESCGHLSESARENLVRLHYNLARALHRSDRWVEAREQASIVIAIDPSYVNAHALRAQAAMATFDWEAALSDWDQLMTIVASGSAAVHLGSNVEKADLVATWRKRREECAVQVSLGHYEVLGLPRIASVEEVRRAYRELALQWHPDKHRQRGRDMQERASRRFERIRQAYEILGEDAAKHAYDATLLLCEARPLMTGHSAASNARGQNSEKLDSETAASEATVCSSPSKAHKACASADLDAEHRSRRPGNLRSTLAEPPVLRSSSRSATRRATIDSPVGQYSPSSSPLNKWVPSFHPSKCPASPQIGKSPASPLVGHTVNAPPPYPPIHVNLFDAQFVNADSATDAF
jgi:tetratricopeptide (TPR) repeat protein